MKESLGQLLEISIISCIAFSANLVLLVEQHLPWCATGKLHTGTAGCTDDAANDDDIAVIAGTSGTAQVHSVVSPDVEDAVNDYATAGSSAGTAADASLVAKDELKDQLKDEVKDEALPVASDDLEVPSGDGDILKSETPPDEEEVKPPASVAQIGRAHV